MLHVYRLENPIPIPALKTLNTYLIPCGDRTLVIDPGMTVESASTVLEKIREEGLPGTVTVLLTHFHVDHVAATPYLDPEEVYMHEADRNHVIRMVDEWPRALESMEDLFLKAGMPHGEVSLLGKKHPAMSRIDVFRKLRNMGPRQAPPKLTVGSCELEIIHTPGHTPGSISIHIGGGRWIVGDTVLGDITPNIALINWETDPLGDYLGSLQRLLRVEPRIMYPGHRSVIGDPEERIKELILHHERRLREIIDVLSSSPVQINAYRIASRMTWDVAYSDWRNFPLSQKYFAVAEALSHLKYLVVRGLAGLSTRNGVYYFKSLHSA
ncbi:MAG: MBL fold metallo-hydrolase [Desulfurococcales archaeon]|nr:MBL fold metallo-hydrolase [Desulfurococcales archaeon]